MKKNHKNIFFDNGIYTGDINENGNKHGKEQ